MKRGSTMIVPPEGLTVPIGRRDHIQGPPNAPMTLLEYGDFECPFCSQVHPIIQAVQERLDENRCFAYRHFPLANAHPHAQRAAEAAEAAGAQGKFWEMHDLLFENQDALEDEDLVEYATALRLDVERFVRELEAGVHAGRVREDFKSGVRSGVNGTPTLFINGARYDGARDVDSLLAALTNQPAAWSE